jgi:hypothetical protein
MKAWMVVKSVEVQQGLHIAELEETNARLRIELVVAHTKVVEVEHLKQTLSSDYDGLHKEFDDLRTSHAVIVQEKRIWRRRSTRRHDDFRICCARNWLSFSAI